MGSYTRYAKVSDSSGKTCTTNTVSVVVDDCTNVCTALPPQAVPNPIATAICYTQNGFASPCESDGSPMAAFSTPTSANGFVNVGALINGGDGKNAIWNIGYYWAPLKKQWIKFLLIGSLYPGTTCAIPSNGCWLSDFSSGVVSVPQSELGDNPLYVIIWKYNYQNGGWVGPPCANATGNPCWILVTGLDIPRILDMIEGAANINQMATIARTSGLKVETYFSAGSKNLTVRHPVTLEGLVYAREASQEREQPTITNDTGKSGSCFVPTNSGAVNVFVTNDSKYVGIINDYKFNVSCAGLAACDLLYQSAQGARLAFDNVSGIAHSSSTGADEIRVRFGNLREDAGGEMSMLSIKDGAEFKNSCLIRISVADEEGNMFTLDALGRTVQHEMGHCFGLAHKFGTFMEPYMGPDDKILPIPQEFIDFLRSIREGGTLQGFSCVAECSGDKEDLSFETGNCEPIQGGSPSPDSPGGSAPTNSGITPPYPTGSLGGCLSVRYDSEGVAICDVGGGVDCFCSGPAYGRCVDADGFSPHNPPANACIMQMQPFSPSRN